MPQSFTRFLLLTLLVTAVICAAALGAPGSAGAARLNPCKLVTKADVRGVLGGAVKDAAFRRVNRAKAATSSAHCDYYGANGNVIVVVHDSAENYPGTDPSFKLMGMKIEPLNGVGVPALQTPGHTASFLKHGTYAQVELIGAGTKNDAALVQLAKIAASRIP